MAITSIYGFQQFRDHLTPTVLPNLKVFGKLPFHINHTWSSPGETAGRWLFMEFQERVWLRYISGTYSTSTTSSGRQLMSQARTPGLNHLTKDVFGDHVNDPECNEFTVGFRVWNRYTGTNRPVSYFSISDSGGNTLDMGVPLLSYTEVPDVENVTFYCEFTFDFNLGVVKRWLDSVRLSDIALGATFGDRSMFHARYLHYGYKHNSSNSSGINYYRGLRDVGFNDFYFVADTSHLADDLPSGRLGPVEIEALQPKTVQLPVTWDNASEKEPAILLKETVDTDNMRDVPALISDASGDRAVVGFETPAYKEGEILYCELETYGYRQFGDGVALNTRTLQGGVAEEAQQHEVEPERLRTAARAIMPAKLHRPLDGGVWVEEKLGDLSLELWSTKPE